MPAPVPETRRLSRRSAIWGPAAQGLERAPRRSEARVSGPQLHGPRGRAAGKPRRGSGDGGARRGGAQSPARGVRAPRTMALWREGAAGAVALAALAGRAGAVPALGPLPGRSGSAGSRGRSSGSLTWGRPRGALSAPPRPAPPLALAASSSAASSKFGSGSFPRSRAGWPRARRRQAGRPGARDLRPSLRAASTPALPGASSPRELSLRLLAPASRGRGASRLQLTPPFSSLPPASHPPSSTCTPPPGCTRPRAPPFPGEAQLLTNIIALPLPFPPPPPPPPWSRTEPCL